MKDPYEKKKPGTSKETKGKKKKQNGRAGENLPPAPKNSSR